MADNYDDIRGMQFQYVDDYHEVECYVAEIDIEKGLTIKALDIDYIEDLGYQPYRGTKNEGNMLCINLGRNPEDKKLLATYAKHLRLVASGEAPKLLTRLVESEVGFEEPEGPIWSMVPCAF